MLPNPTFYLPLPFFSPQCRPPFPQIYFKVMINRKLYFSKNDLLNFKFSEIEENEKK